MSTAPNLSVAELSEQATMPVGVASQPVDRPWLDRLGISASLLCAVHCMLAPFLLLLIPTAGSIWSHPAVHWVLAALVLPLALWVIFKGYRKHKKRLTLFAAGVGAACILAGLIAPMVYTQALFSVDVPTFGFFHESLMPYAGSACTDVCCPTATYDAKASTLAVTFPPGGLVTLIGSLFLVAAHMTNLVACRCYSRKRQACGDETTGCGCTV